MNVGTILFSLQGLMDKLFLKIIWNARNGNDWFVLTSPTCWQKHSNHKKVYFVAHFHGDAVYPFKKDMDCRQERRKRPVGHRKKEMNQK